MSEIAVAAVLFDMDGTLVDSTAMVERLWLEFARANGAPEADVVGFAHGRPSRDTVDRYVADPSERDRWMTWIHDHEASTFDGTLALPGAVDLTRAMPDRRWAVATSALHGPALARLAGVGIPRPPVLIGADDVEHGKPAPDPYLDAAAGLGVEPADCLVFEDAPAGVEAGIAAGCTVVVVGSLDTELTRGLARVPDLGHVSADTTRGRLVLTLR